MSSPLEMTTTDQLTSETSWQQSAHSSSGLLQDLTKELQNRSQYPVTCGAYGDIYKCDLVKPDGIVQVAVKTIRALQSDNEVLMQKNSKRIRRELKVWGRLKHNSILPLWGVATDFGPYLAMVCPWAGEGALTNFLERQEDTLTLEDKFTLLTDIALGLQYLHSRSIVHGDLTGSNVLIYDNGRACITDFGLSTMIEEFVGTSYPTSSVKGNIRWAAAEIYGITDGDEEDDASMSHSAELDIYSFGSMILQVLTCKVPYYDIKKDNVVLGHVIRGKKPDPPKDSQIAPVHWEFIQRCWLPRASRPSIGEVVQFAHQQYCQVHPNDTVDSGNPSGKSSVIWPGTWSGNWSGYWSDSDSDEGDDSDDDGSRGTSQDTGGESLDQDRDDEEDDEDDEGQQGSEGDSEDDEDSKGGDCDDHDDVIDLDGSDNDDSSSGIDQGVEREDLDEDNDNKRVEGNSEGHEDSEDDDNESSEGVEGNEDIESSDDDESDVDYESDNDDNDNDNGYDDDGDNGANSDWSDGSC